MDKKTKKIVIILLSILCVCIIVFVAVLLKALDERKNNETTVAQTETTTTAPTTTAKKTTAATTTAKKTTEAQTEKEAEKMVSSFGHPVAESIANANKKTLENEKSGVVDVLSNPTYTPAEVRAMIEKYNRNYDTSVIKDTDPLTIQYGILVYSPDVRSYPVSDPEMKGQFDMLQETKLNFASGVIVLHQTEDKEWSFVQGYNYNGWILTNAIAFCTFEEMENYLTTDNFIVSLTATGDNVYDRLGVILPYESKSSKESGWTVKLPVRDANGNLKIQPYFLTNSNKEIFTEGFLPFSNDAVLTQMKRLLDVPYGWGDMYGYYDCSSTVGGVYSLFGFVMPRNTSQLQYAGMNVLDITSDKAAIAAHPGAILVMKGHAMIYEGGKNILHNTTIDDSYKVIRSDYTTTKTSSGKTIEEQLTTLIYFE